MYRNKWYGFRTCLNMNYKNNRDRFSIYLTNENEMRKLSRKLNYSLDEIMAAVQEVGFNEEEIAEYIRDRNDRELFNHFY
jgi:Protein of unknown function (DUF3606)